MLGLWGLTMTFLVFGTTTKSHVFHRDDPQQRLLPHDQRAGKPHPCSCSAIRWVQRREPVSGCRPPKSPPSRPLLAIEAASGRATECRCGRPPYRPTPRFLREPSRAGRGLRNSILAWVRPHVSDPPSSVLSRLCARIVNLAAQHRGRPLRPHGRRGRVRRHNGCGPRQWKQCRCARRRRLASAGRSCG